MKEIKYVKTNLIPMFSTYAVYLLYEQTDNDDYDLVYIGKSHNVVRRLDGHVRQPHGKVIHWAEILLLNSEEDQKTIEKVLIMRNKPKYNKCVSWKINPDEYKLMEIVNFV